VVEVAEVPVLVVEVAEVPVLVVVRVVVQRSRPVAVGLAPAPELAPARRELAYATVWGMV